MSSSRFPLTISSLTFVLFSTAAVACGGETSNNSATDTPNATSGGSTSGNPACENGSTRCDGDRISTCENHVFSPSVACEGDAVCRQDTCRAPTTKQLAQAKELGEMLSYLRANTAWHAPLDWSGLEQAGRRQILGGDGTDRAYFGALYKAFVAVPQGHQGLYLSGAGAKSCGRLVPYPGYSQRGACGRPHAKGIIVTNAKASNILGVKKGDVITRVGSASARDLLGVLWERPMCATSRPNTSFRDATTAASFIDLLEKGDEVEIESSDGSKRTVTAPDAPLGGNLQAALNCQDPFGRRTDVAVESEIRADGIGVIRLPGFTDAEQEFPENPTQAQYEAYKDAFEAKIKVAFDKVKSAPGLVWDIRGNGGGLTMVGLNIASGFPGANANTLSYCTSRVPDTDPPQFNAMPYATYALTPAETKFAYAGKVAIVIEGLNYSAADYFPLAVKSRTTAKVVGAATAGAFGAVSDSKQFSRGELPFNVSVDLNRCVDATDGSPLEGRSVAPQIAVDYDAVDLAAGQDTVLERAVAEVK